METLFDRAGSRWFNSETRRVIIAERPSGPFAQYERREYVFPVGALDIVTLAESHFAGERPPAHVEGYRVEAFAGRDLLVCTNGQVDICCARLGVPAYRVARDRYPEIRVWRASHFGGHRFAPTLWELPSGYRWGFMDEQALVALLEHDADTTALSDHMRGWTGVTGPAQLLDREGFRREGWRWLDYQRSAEILQEGREARVWRARLTYITPDGVTGAFEGTIEVARYVPNVGCGPDWGERDGQTPVYGLRDFVAL